MKTLTDRQHEVYEFILAHVERNNSPPTIREIGSHFGMKSTGTVRDNLRALERKGYIRLKAMAARGIELLRREALSGAAGLRRIPVLGSIAAGQPLLAVENIDEYLHVDPRLLDARGSLFGLTVQGDSMRDAGIHDGDYVFVRKQETAENGDIVAAIIDDEATVKRYFHEGRRIRLQPANDALAPIYISSKQAEVMIAGKVVGVFRKM
jgi:repressor LexA